MHDIRKFFGFFDFLFPNRTTCRLRNSELRERQRAGAKRAAFFTHFLFQKYTPLSRLATLPSL